MNSRRCLSALSLLVACSGMACEPDTIITVSNTADGGPGSLRAAVVAANGADPSKTVRIELPTGTYSLSLCGTDDTNAAGDLDLTTHGSVMIVGTGPNVVIEQTCPEERVLDALGTGILTLIDVTVSGGRLTEQDPTITGRGGGVRAAGSVVLQRAKITGNQATSAAGGPVQGGGLFVGGDLVALDAAIDSNKAGQQSFSTVNAFPLAPGGDAEGGGAYVIGAITVTNGEVSNNGAFGGNARGGGLAQASMSTQPVRVSGTTFNGNGVLGGNGVVATFPRLPGNVHGGGLATAGVTTLVDATFSNNRADGGYVVFGGCGQANDSTFIWVCPGPNPGGNADGGAVWSACNLTLTRGTYSDNATLAGTGGGFGVGHLDYPIPVLGQSGSAVQSLGTLVVNP